VTGPPRQRTIDEVAAPYSNFLVRVPRVAHDVCQVCRSAVEGWPTCYPCNDALKKLGAATADVVAFVSMAPNDGQMATELFTYKRPDMRLDVRRPRQIGLAAVLWKWLSLHERCMASTFGVTKFDVITTVPSSSGRLGTHPLEEIASTIVTGTAQRYEALLSLGTSEAGHRGFAADRFVPSETAAGRRVLVIDDTWTTGAHAQSASAAVKAGGATGVGVLSIGRWFNVGWGTNRDWIGRHRAPGWDWARCCLEP
jgi:predicted amidophosphoribosyltransferase